MSNTITPFTYVNSILQKKPLSEDHDWSEYIPFIVNRSLSYHYDCVLFVNEINQRPQLNKEQQFDFLYNTIKKKFRKFEPWQKKQKDDSVALIQEFYTCNRQTALDYLKILSAEELKRIESAQGGKGK